MIKYNLIYFKILCLLWRDYVNDDYKKLRGNELTILIWSKEWYTIFQKSDV